jgi:serine/threonine protein kinase/tetratricopeptide (TPR) repeat protein
MKVLTGTEFSGYRIIEALGQGGQSMVYLALDIRLRRKVAIKFLSDDSLEDEHGRRRFLLEAQTLSSLNHPNIATVYHIGEYQEHPFIVMEYVDGRTLQDYLAHQHLADEALLGLIIGIVEAIRDAHEKGIIHRDLKPGNIMVTREGQPKLLDFGLARITREDERKRLDSPTELTATGVVMGTVYYLSPEQAVSNTASERSDLFSLGVILYEILAGCRPFDRNSALTTLYAIIHADPPPLPPSSPLAVSLRPVVARLLEKQPEKRYTSARALLVDLRDIQSEGLGQTSRVVSRTLRLKVASNALPRVLMTAFLTLSVLIGTYFLWKGLRASQGEETVVDPGPPTVLVLPIKSGPSEAERHLAAIITSEIVAGLSRTPNLQVLSIPSSGPETNDDWRERIIRHNQVGFTLTGGLTQEENRLRLSVQIVNPKDYRVLWSRIFNEEISRIFTIPTVIAARLAFEAGVVFKAEQLNFPGSEAFGLYTRAVMLLSSYDPVSLPQSVNLLRDCIGVAPHFRPAYEMLSQALMQYRNTGVDYNPDFLEEAYAVIRKGREMAGDSPRLRVQEIWYHMYCYDFSRAFSLSDSLLQEGLKPAESYKQRVWLAFFAGQGDLAMTLLEEAVQREPYDSSAYLNRVVLGTMLEKSDQTIEVFHQEAGEIFRSPLVAAIIEGWRKMSRADYRAAFEVFSQLRHLERHRLMDLAAGEALFAEGDFSGAVPLLDSWVRQNPYAMEGWWLLALCHEALGQKAEHLAVAKAAFGHADHLSKRFPGDFMHTVRAYFAILQGQKPDLKPMGTDGQAVMTLYLQQVCRVRLGLERPGKEWVVPFNPTYWMNRFYRQELALLNK